MNVLDHFRHTCADNLFRTWLEQEKAKAIEALAAGDGPALHRWQGRFQLIKEQLELMDKARNLR